jgi:hypothetical protein
MQRLEYRASEAVSVLGGFDLRGVSCDLEEFVPKDKGISIVQWRNVRIGCWQSDRPCPANVNPDFLEAAEGQYTCLSPEVFCTGEGHATVPAMSRHTHVCAHTRDALHWCALGARRPHRDRSLCAVCVGTCAYACVYGVCVCGVCVCVCTQRSVEHAMASHTWSHGLPTAAWTARRVRPCPAHPRGTSTPRLVTHSCSSRRTRAVPSERCT